MNYLILLYIVSIFNVFHLTPFSFFADLYIHVFSFLGIVSFFSSKLYRNGILRFTFFTILALILSSIFSSVLILKQDVFSSVVAIQHIFKGFSILYIFKLFTSNRIDIYLIFRNLITTIWIFTIILTIASLTHYSFTFLSPISGKQLVITANKYSKDLLYFGEFYFLAKYFHSNKSINLLFLTLIFISTQLYDIQRGDLIFFSVTFFISLILFRKKVSTQKIYFLLPIFVLVAFLFINNSDSSNKLKDKFSQLAMVFDEEQSGKIDDASIFVRLREIDFALVGFVKHPISGNGMIRSSKQQQLIGDIYFYPADIGMYGVLYTFGLIGIYFFVQFIRRLFKFKFSKLNFLSSGLFLFLVYSIFYSFKDGSVIFNPTQFLFCYLVIHLLDNNNNNNIYKIKVNAKR